MVKYPDKWHHGIVTNYFSTSQAKGNKKIKAGYVVDFIVTKDWENGLQPKKGKKMRSPDEEEEELFADDDVAAIVEAAKEDTRTCTFDKRGVFMECNLDRFVSLTGLVLELAPTV